MKIKNYRFVITCLILILLSSCFCPVTSYAASKSGKSKKECYIGRGYQLSQFGDFGKNLIYKISNKKNKVIIKGALVKGKSPYNHTGPFLKSKTRAFKMTKNCKFYYGTGKGGQYLSKKKFFNKLNKKYGYMFQWFYIYTNSSGKAYRIFVDYSM